MKNLVILIVLFILSAFYTEAKAGAGTFPQGDHIKQLKDKIEFKNSNVQIITNDSDDPTVVSKTATIGSIYVKADDGKIYTKTDSGSSTNWDIVLNDDDLTTIRANIATNTASISENTNSIATLVLDDIVDVVLTSTATGDNLYWDGSAWKNGSYSQTIEVDCDVTSKAQFHTIQSAIDSISDNSSSKPYSINIHPCIYNEQIVMEDWVTLDGTGKKSSIIITGAIGPLVTFPSDANSRQSIKDIAILLVPTTDAQVAILTSSESTIRNSIDNVLIQATSSTNNIQATLVDQEGGDLIYKNSKFVYTMSGTHADVLEHELLDINGTFSYHVLSNDFEVDISDENDNVRLIDEVESGTAVHEVIKDNIIHINMLSGSYTGTLTVFFLHGSGADKALEQNHVMTTSAGDGKTYFMKLNTTTDDGMVQSTGNFAMMSGFDESYIAAIGAGDTIYSNLNTVRGAVDGLVGSGSLVYAASGSAGTFQTSGAITSGATITAVGYEGYGGALTGISSGVTDHGALTGLGDDDHSQYVLADGTRDMVDLTVTGSVSIGALSTEVAPTNFMFRDTDGIIKQAPVSGGGLSDPTTTRGDIIFRNSSNVTDRKALGTANQVLISDGTDLQWAAAPASSGITWNVVTTDTTMSANNGYIASVSDTGTPLKFYLPTTLATGSLFSIAGNGNDGWELYTNSGAVEQNIKHQGETTISSTSSVNLLANSIESYGSMDIITNVKDTSLVSRNYYNTLFSLKVPYFDGITSHWTMDQGTGDLIDKKGSYDLLRVGTPNFITGKLDGAYDTFSNANTFQQYHADFDLSNTSGWKLTVEMWVKFVASTSASYQMAFTNGGAGYAYPSTAGVVFFNLSSLIKFGHATNNSQADSSALSDGEWHYVVGVIDETSTSGTRKWIYIDGVSVGSVQNTVNTYNTADGYIAIGSGSEVRQWQGAMDDVVYWQGTAMTQAQITERYNAGEGKRYN